MAKHLEETSNVVKKLDPFNVQVILDYGVEGKEGEENFDHATDEFIKSNRICSNPAACSIYECKAYGPCKVWLIGKITCKLQAIMIL